MNAVSLFTDLRERGFAVEISTGGVAVSPATRLTPEDAQQLRTHRDALLELLVRLDDGVRARLRRFEELLAVPRHVVLPALTMLDPAPTPEAGRCGSCGVLTGSRRWGACWRCRCAWRLAIKVSLDDHALPQPGEQIESTHVTGTRGAA